MNRLARLATRHATKNVRFSSTSAALTLDKAHIAVNDFLSHLAEQRNLSIPEAQKVVADLVSEGKVVHFDKNTSLQQVIFVQPETIADTLSMSVAPDAIAKSIELETAHLESMLKQLETSIATKKELDTRALNIVYRNWKLFTGYLVAQMLFYMKLTWIDYGWDVTEPITYMTSFTVVLGSYIYFVVFRRDYTYNDLRNRMIAKKALKLYQRENFDHLQFDALIDQVNQSKQNLENGLRHLYGNGVWPEPQVSLLSRIETLSQKKSIKM